MASLDQSRIAMGFNHKQGLRLLVQQMISTLIRMALVRTIPILASRPDIKTAEARYHAFLGIYVDELLHLRPKLDHTLSHILDSYKLDTKEESYIASLNSDDKEAYFTYKSVWHSERQNRSS